MTVLFFFLFLVSVAINAMLVWYIRKLLQEIAPIHQRTVTIRNSLTRFVQDVDEIYELPTFYGDQTIKNLVVQTKAMVEEVDAYKKSFIFESEGETFEEATEPETEE